MEAPSALTQVTQRSFEAGFVNENFRAFGVTVREEDPRTEAMVRANVRSNKFAILLQE